MSVSAVLRRVAAIGAIVLVGSTKSLAGEGCREDPAMAGAFNRADAHGTFVLLDGQTGEAVCHGAARAGKGFLPASTYKIPNSLISLETGVASGGDFALAWDSRRDPKQSWWPQAWARSHTLATALPASVVWFYQELARRVGPQRMQEYVNRFNYGNRDIGGGIDRFWLAGDLRISALQQVDFLQRFYTGSLGISSRSTQIVKDALVLEQSDVYRLSGKTGWARVDEADPNQIGWFVGYLERGASVYFFALNMDMRKPGHGAARLGITQDILRQRGLMP